MLLVIPVRAVVAVLFLAIPSMSQLQRDVSSTVDTACHEKGAKILILGTYHFDNPGRDSANVRVDDVLAEKRQREIASVLDRLANFKPTKIAIEAPYKSTHWPNLYKAYLEGKYQLGRNEIEQIGFRLARRLGLQALYPIDYPMYMSGLIDAEIEVTKPKPSETVQLEQKPPKFTEADKKFIETPIVDHLLNLNRRESINRSHEQYLTMLLPNPENTAIYERADRVSNWYKRNLRMFSNLNRIAEFNGQDRILLIVGAGHLKILNGFAVDAPQFCFVPAETYLSPTSQ